jgi:hypothetical protein
MCFSAEVSFGASAVITTIGVVSYKKAGETPLRYIAFIPILFGVHQFVEGFVWLSNLYNEFTPWKQFATNVFLIFAWIIWPIYIPFAMWKNETEPVRKKILRLFIFIGLTVAAGLLYSLATHGAPSEIRGHSIHYDFDKDHPLKFVVVILYFTTVVLSTVVSKVTKMWWLGAANIILFTLSKIYVADKVVSVWCFTAALTSILILYIIIQEKKKQSVIIYSMDDD